MSSPKIKANSEALLAYLFGKLNSVGKETQLKIIWDTYESMSEEEYQEYKNGLRDFNQTFDPSLDYRNQSKRPKGI